MMCIGGCLAKSIISW